MVPRLQNEAIMLLEDARRRNREFPPSQYRRVYRNTTQDSPLRACIVKMWPDLTISNSELYPRELLVDLVNRLGPMKRRLEEETSLGLFGEVDGDTSFEFDPTAFGLRDDAEDMLEVPQKGKTKRKLVQTDFAEYKTRGSIA